MIKKLNGIPRPLGSVLLLGILAAAFYAPLFYIGGDHRAYISGDFVTHVFPIRQMMSRIAQMGTMPLWNPYLWSGHPAIGDASTQTFYPLKFVTLWFEWKRLYVLLEAIAVFHIVLGGALMLLLMRTIEVSWKGAIASAIVFMFNGYFEAHLNHSNLVESAIWMPGVLAFLTLSFRQRKPCYIAAAAICLGMSALASFVEVVFYIIVAMVLWAVFFSVGWWRRGEEARVAPRLGATITIAVIGVGIGVAAVQLLPMYELSRLSAHTALTFEQATQLSMAPAGLFSILIPRVLESRSMAYCGSIALVLAMIGLWRGPRSKTSVFAALGIVSLAFALGRYSPAYRVLYLMVPGVDCFRTPERWLLLYVFAISGLAGLGVDALARGPRPEAGRMLKRVRNALPGLIILGVVLAFLLRPVALNDRQCAFQIGMFALVLMVATGVFAAGLARPSVARLLPLLMICLLVSDAFITLRGVNLGRQDPFLRYAKVRDTATALAREGGAYRVSNIGGWENWPGMVGLEHIRGYGPMPLRRYISYLRCVSTNPQLLDALNVRYVLDDFTVAYKNARAFPRAFLVDRYLVERDPSAIASHLSQPSSIDLRYCVVLEEEPDSAGSLEQVGWGESATSPRQSVGTADLESRAPDALQVRTRSDRDAFLVLSEVFYPGWEATLDGDAVPIMRGDYIFRVISVPRGEHLVSLRYRPGSFLLGAAISGLFVLLCVAGLLLGDKPRRIR